MFLFTVFVFPNVKAEMSHLQKMFVLVESLLLITFLSLIVLTSADLGESST